MGDLTPEQFEARTKEVLAEESARPLSWYYLSFADEERFRGGTLVQARGALGASIVAREHGVNPGGEMLAFPLEDDDPRPEALQYKLITDRETLEKLFEDDGGVVKLGEIE